MIRFAVVAYMGGNYQVMVPPGFRGDPVEELDAMAEAIRAERDALLEGFAKSSG